MVTSGWFSLNFAPVAPIGLNPRSCPQVMPLKVIISKEPVETSNSVENVEHLLERLQLLDHRHHLLFFLFHLLGAFDNCLNLGSGNGNNTVAIADNIVTRIDRDAAAHYGNISR